MEQLDDLDIRILGDLGSPGAPQRNVRASYAELARRFGVDEETVRLRVKRARERGILPGWRISLNPRLIGYGAAGLTATVADEAGKREAIARLRALPGVQLIADYLGPGLLLLAWYESDDGLAQLTRSVGAIVGGTTIGPWRTRYERPTIAMRRIDWRILDVMRTDARMELGRVATALGVTVRTVQRRLRAMAEGKAFHLSGTPDVARVGGLICDFLVQCPDPVIKREADARIGSTLPRIGASDTSSEGFSIFGVACGNLAQAEEIRERMRVTYGGGEVQLGVVREFVPVERWQAEEIHRRAEPVPTATVPPSVVPRPPARPRARRQR